MRGVINQKIMKISSLFGNDFVRNTQKFIFFQHETLIIYKRGVEMELYPPKKKKRAFLLEKINARVYFQKIYYFLRFVFSFFNIIT